MPESSPVASGWFRSSSMMNRSIVTTDVAVCLTTLIILSEVNVHPTLTDARRGVVARIDLETISNIPAPQRLPQVENREGSARFKLVDVPKLVQEQFSRRRCLGRQPNRVP